jgi:hypothetical protein
MSTPERDEATNTQLIVVNWQAITAPDNGNSDVLSYSLEYDAGTNGESWETLIGYLADFTGTQMQVTSKIQRGVRFIFRLRAKNIWGWGVYSEEYAILAARRPL